ncbi:MAG TPA: hypothetical protein PLU72_17740 [Candidatus Ozemobacteraceae bacterium]|nr:hypothetical protein [Candidatus Ozemobacteraceae bacterium]
MADGWLFVTGGSFALSSDDIVVFALYHPEKEILRILFAQYTGTVESGRYLIDPDGRGIIISQECLGNDPPRRFIISRGIPREDAAFRDAFAAAFRGLASRLELSPTGWHYSRTLSFNSSDRAPQLDLTIHPMADTPQACEYAVSMIYRDGMVIVMPLVSRIGSKVMRP